MAGFKALVGSPSRLVDLSVSREQLLAEGCVELYITIHDAAQPARTGWNSVVDPRHRKP